MSGSRLATGAGAVVAGALLVAGCQGGGTTGASGPSGGGGADAAKVTITPANGAAKVSPDKGVTVSVANGKVGQVTVADSKGGTIAGAPAANGTSWHTTYGLKPGTDYTVTAKATGPDQKQVSSQAKFATLKADKKLGTSLSPLDGEKVGVGMPIQLLLTKPSGGTYAPASINSKAKRQAIERSLEVRTSTPLEGSWYWTNLNTEVDFRPKSYWPSGTKVKVIAHLTGVHAGSGLWGSRDRETSFTIGPKHISTIKNSTHTMTVKSGDKTERTIPVSMGRPGDDTYSGTTIAQEKAAHIIMDSATTGDPGAYRIPTSWNVRMTYSGTFVHAAPWSVGAQGSTNVSHGCVNVAPANAQWFFNFTNRGDIIKVVGTSRKLQFGNGPTPWVLSWKDWQKGSALGKTVTTKKL
ncbi:MAG TPA: Ig-like domain-containing protein [Streptosporangiaceae bacterium]